MITVITFFSFQHKEVLSIGSYLYVAIHYRIMSSQRRGRTIVPSGHQIGKTHVRQDRALPPALKPGRRISARGRKYTENRKNRSDLRNRVWNILIFVFNSAQHLINSETKSIIQCPLAHFTNEPMPIPIVVEHTMVHAVNLEMPCHARLNQWQVLQDCRGLHES